MALLKVDGYSESPIARGRLSKKGLPLGMWKIYFPQSSRVWQKGQFDSGGNKTGAWNIYSKTGKEIAKVTYKHGRITGYKIYEKGFGLNYVISTDILFLPGLTATAIK